MAEDLTPTPTQAEMDEHMRKVRGDKPKDASRTESAKKAEDKADEKAETEDEKKTREASASGGSTYKTRAGRAE